MEKEVKPAIVITSIFEPTEAVVRFAKMPEYQLIVVGDNKTPANWSHPQVRFISMAEQKQMDFALAGVLPENHYCRKMMGYLEAIQSKAPFIVDTDDDNIPKEDWTFPALSGDFLSTPEDLGFINVYKYYSEQHIWPRGLPLRLIKTDPPALLPASPQPRIGVWQGLADEDPDVDAIYRLTSDTPCNFNAHPPMVLKKGTISPFNTQNTLVRSELYALLYLPTYVTFRFTDILRGFVAQPIMWAAGFDLGFIGATVVQKRNPHDYMKDFISEIPMYQHTDKVMEVVGAAVKSSNSIEDNLHNAYTALLGAGIVVEKEIETLEAWLTDLAKIRKA